jgi:hypothetical protein
MKASLPGLVNLPASVALPPSQYLQPPAGVPSMPLGPIQFRFVLKFAAQMSTPCSRGVAVKPRAGRMPTRRAPRLFQSYLQRHSVLQ